MKLLATARNFHARFRQWTVHLSGLTVGGIQDSPQACPYPPCKTETTRMTVRASGHVQRSYWITAARARERRKSLIIHCATNILQTDLLDTVPAQEVIIDHTSSWYPVMAETNKASLRSIALQVALTKLTIAAHWYCRFRRLGPSDPLVLDTLMPVFPQSSR